MSTEGDLFVQLVADKDELVDAMAMPAVGIERMTNERDRFSDMLNAFRQIDVATNEVLNTFAYWQIVHGRWNFKDGERYGNSQYLQMRRMSEMFLGMLDDMAIRRRTRGPARRHHMLGTKEKPGTKTQVEEYIKFQNMHVLDEAGNLTQIMDYYSSPNVEIKDLAPDTKLGDIDDIKFFLDVMMPRTGVAKGLIGFG